MNRDEFLKWSENVLRACALPGAVPTGFTPYRNVRVAPRRYIGIDALSDGILRVYLYSNVSSIKENWLKLKLALEGPNTPAHVEPVPAEARSRLYVRDNGEEQRGFLGFEWRLDRKAPLDSELDVVTRYVTWLHHVCLKG